MSTPDHEKELDKMSIRELRVECANLRWINTAQAERIRTLLREVHKPQLEGEDMQGIRQTVADLREQVAFSAQWIESIQQQRRDEKVFADAQVQLIKSIEKAVICRHENMSSKDFGEVVCYHCEDCGYGWSD